MLAAAHRTAPLTRLPSPQSLYWCTDWCAEPSLFLGKGGHELAAEVGDVWDHAAPYQVALAERRLVHPNRAGVLQVVFDPQRASSPRPIDYAGRDRNEPAVTDDADGLVPFVHGPDKACNLGIAPKLVRCPAARHHHAIQPRGVDTIRCRIGLCLQGVLATDKFCVGSDGDDLGPLLLQTHHSDPVLEVLETLGHENSDLLPLQPHRDSSRIIFTRPCSTIEACSPRAVPLRRRAREHGPAQEPHRRPALTGAVCQRPRGAPYSRSLRRAHYYPAPPPLGSGRVSRPRSGPRGAGPLPLWRRARGSSRVCGRSSPPGASCGARRRQAPAAFSPARPSSSSAARKALCPRLEDAHPPVVTRRRPAPGASLQECPFVAGSFSRALASRRGRRRNRRRVRPPPYPQNALGGARGGRSSGWRKTLRPGSGRRPCSPGS